ncbi:class I SAM-dependent methyltransferase [Actinomadura darangshiensis]|uniref:Class I SAM-dependent methyltransferase n=1 Tax=Actinomadura darangshiensis TaxID=705336 RepID=A0A4R5A939_9ACTN|nr:class I SAM-dependent methyltransferase [Actinomadura darangshiensis]TDD68808.1 class I SAM-dependent methyltransferase [Actinomadura darangshiensis]
MPRHLDDTALEMSPVVANCAMNRERRLDGYTRELGIDVLAELGDGRWLDLCCGTGRALTEAATARPTAKITGIDLVDHFTPLKGSLNLITASVTTWTPDAPSDLITCVHGLHYIGDKLGALTRATTASPYAAAEKSLPYRYLSADDQAGPNYTGQPAVDSHYTRTTADPGQRKCDRSEQKDAT